MNYVFFSSIEQLLGIRLSDYVLAVTQKNYSLEAMRGMAAVVVVACHTIFSFSPGSTGFYLKQFGAGYGLRTSPIEAFFNGTAAVVFFFVLSGFVLTRAYFRTRDTDLIGRGAAKRWPRLAGPVLLSVLFSYTLYRFGFFSNLNEAVALSKSPWLGPTLSLSDASLSRALTQGTTTFFTGDNSLNGPLWTMQYEFFGSYLAFTMALSISFVPRVIWLLGAAIVFVICAWIAPPFAGFPLGVVLASVLPFTSRPLNKYLAFASILMALYLFGYTHALVPVYQWFGRFPTTSAYLVGSILLICVAELYFEHKRFSNNQVVRILGELSFPLYLVHHPIICSLGCWMYVSTRSALMAALATAVGCVAAAAPLMLFNRWWVAAINRYVAVMQHSRRIAGT